MSTICDYCSKAPSDTLQIKLCSICEIAKYCSVECQKSAWSDHRVPCNILHEKEQKDAINCFCDAKIHPFLMAYAYKVKKENSSQIGICSFTKSSKGYVGSLSTNDRDIFNLNNNKESIMVWYKKNTAKGGEKVCNEINCSVDGSAHKYYKEYKKYLLGARTWLIYYDKTSNKHYMQIIYPDDTIKQLDFK